jgi:predicted metal-dependent phosphoesterase TrpH
MIEYDLHIHTNSSDGLLSPDKVFEIAVDKNLKGISITDHDTVDALKRCSELSQSFDIEFIPGIEMSCDYNGLEVHIIGYYIDYDDVNLQNALSKIQKARLDRANKMVYKLRELGYDITFEEVIEKGGGDIKSIGRPHIARILVSKGYFSKTSDVFDNLIGFGKPAYVERFKITIEEAVKMISASNGVSVIAHPLIIKGFEKNEKFESFIIENIKYGIKGIEVYHTLHTEEDEVYLRDMADRYNLIITGGSDCHGVCTNNEYMLGSKGITTKEIDKLKAAKR